MENNPNITDDELMELGRSQLLQKELKQTGGEGEVTAEVAQEQQEKAATQTQQAPVNPGQTLAEKEAALKGQSINFEPLKADEEEFVPTSLPADEFQAKYEAEMKRQQELAARQEKQPREAMEATGTVETLNGVQESTKEEYPSTGLVIDNKDLKGSQDDGIEELPAELKDNISKYLDNFEQDFEDSKEIRTTLGAIVDPTSLSKEEREQRENPQFDLDDVPNGKGTVKPEEVKDDEIEIDEEIVYDEHGNERSTRSVEAEKRMVVIDKLAEAPIVFNEEERSKLERAKVIRLREIENTDVKTRRRKKLKDQKSALGKILKRRTNTLTEYNVALPASGYSAVMQGCSPHEIMTLENDEDGDRRTNALNKWTLIYDKIKTTSLGDLTFDEFMEETATMDMDSLLYGILGATFPEKDKVTLRCANEECKDKQGNQNEYDVPYDIRSLLRIEQLSDKGLDIVDRLVSEGYTKEGAKRIHEDALIGTVKEVVLPETGYIVTLAAASAADFIDRVLTFVDDGVEANKAQAAIIASSIPEILVPEDPYDPDTGYFAFTEMEVITDIIYGLPIKDTQILAKMGSEFTENGSFTFGLLDAQCPHCGKKDDVVDIDISQILFYRNGLAMNMIVE